VADALIMETQFETEKLLLGSKISSSNNPNKVKNKTKRKAKEEQNVKRRVYDALNVLIAAKVLRKASKIVYFNDSDTDRNYKHEKKCLSKSLQQKEMIIKKKKIQLTNLVEKFVEIKGLIDRNIANQPKAQVKFPFLLIGPAGGNNTVVTFEMQPDYMKLLLQSNKEMMVYGDLEVLIMLNVHQN